MGRKKLYASATARKRAQRARESAARSHQLDARPAVVAVVDHADPVGALAQWASATLIVPPGHPRSGQPMTLPDFAVDWLRASWSSHESALSTARKNAKSAIAAVLALGYLIGPLRRPGWRGAVASLDKGKAAELRRQVAEIAEASGLDVKIRRSPYPGVIESSTGSLDTLSADRTAGHASGYDLVIVDETGLFPLRARDLLAGLRSSVSARAGKIRHISIRGDSELFREILENPAVVSSVFAAADDCEIDDAAAWAAANPGLGTIKSIGYMREEVARVAGVAERIDGRSLADASDAAYQAGDLARAAELSREPNVHLDPLAVKKQIRALDAGEPCDDPTVQRSYAVRDRNRELERERAEPDQQQAGEQERISWVERELDRIAAAIREVREYIERAREWAREQAQARRVAGVDRDEGRGR